MKGTGSPLNLFAEQSRAPRNPIKAAGSRPDTSPVHLPLLFLDCMESLTLILSVASIQTPGFRVPILSLSLSHHASLCWTVSTLLKGSKGKGKTPTITDLCCQRPGSTSGFSCLRHFSDESPAGMRRTNEFVASLLCYELKQTFNSSPALTLWSPLPQGEKHQAIFLYNSKWAVHTLDMLRKTQ